MTSTHQRIERPWRARVRIPGNKDKIKWFETQTEAEEWARGLEAQLLSELPAIADWRPEPTLAQELEWYWRWETSETPEKLKARMRRRIDGWKNSKLAQLGLSQLTPAHFEQSADGRAGNAVQGDLSLISDLFRVARLKWGMGHLENPIAVLRKPKQRRLSADEAARFRRAVDEHPNDLFGRIVHFAIRTGARQGEILRLKKTDVDFGRGIAIFRGSKLDNDRMVPLTKYALVTLRFNATTGPYAFPMTRTEITREWRHILERADIRDFRFRDLRHDSTTRMFPPLLMTMVIYPRDKRLPVLPYFTKRDLGYFVERLDETEKSESAPRKAENSAGEMTVNDLPGHVKQAESVGAPIVPTADGKTTALVGPRS